MKVNYRLESEDELLRNRDISVDIIRGFAIFTMVASNMTPYVFDGELPLWFRFYGTFAAPLFVFLAGMMVKMASARKHGFSYYLWRGLALLGVGAAIDTYVWGLFPFLSVDVLYLLGIAMPFCYLVGRLPTAVQVVVTAALFAGVSILQEWSSYRSAPDNFVVASGISFSEVLDRVDLVQAWLIDGWFPVFPWLGVAMAGYLAGEVRIRRPSFTNATTFAIGLGALLVGGLMWQEDSTAHLARGGYPDLFYPPTLAFFLLAAGVVMLLFYFVDRTKSNRLYLPFNLYGRCSMLMYIAHTLVIGFYFRGRGDDLPLTSLTGFFRLYLLVMTGLLVLAVVVNALKPKNLHPAIRFFVGG